MKRIYLLSLVFVCCLCTCIPPYTVFAQAGHGIVKGTITTNDGIPASAISVAIEQNSRGTISDEKGKYVISKLPAGNYILKVSAAGIVPQEKKVVVTADQVTEENFVIDLTSQQLEDVIVNTHRNKFADRETDYIARMPLKNMENPQVYNTVGKDLIKEQLATDMAQAQSNIPGALVIAAGGGSIGITSRGFTTYGALRNGMNASAIGPEDPVNIERIEALKGPVGTLFGSMSNTSFGGLLNYVTKKPYDQFGGEISYTAGSYQLNRITADINTPLNADQTLLLRTTGSFQTRNGYTDGGGGLWNNTYSFSPKLTYKVSPRLTLHLEVEAIAQKYSSVFGYAVGPEVTAKSFKDLLLPYDETLAGNNLYNSNFMLNVSADADYRISDKWASQTRYSYSEGHYGQFLYATANWLTDSTVTRQISDWIPDNKFGQTEFQQNITGDFKIGNLKNRLVAGIDWSEYYYNLNRSDNYAQPFDTVNVQHPIAQLNNAILQDYYASYPFDYFSYRKNVYSVYASDVLNLTGNLLLMLSLRVSRDVDGGSYDSETNKTAGKYNQTQLSPKLGIVYQLIKDKISLFANYNNGFNNIAPAATAPDGDITALKPQQAYQAEGGVKFDLFEGKLSSTLSYYNIRVTNATYTDPDNAAFTVQDGTQRSRGFEADMIVNPVTGLNIVAGYGYNENKYVKSSAGLEGKYAQFAPRNIGNLWISYKLMKGMLKGMGIGAGGNYAGDCWFNAANTFVLNGYTMVNASVFYSLRKYDLNIKINNINNAHYWNTVSAPQMPRNVAVGVSYKF